MKKALLLLAMAFSIPAIGQLQFQKRINVGAGDNARSLIKTSDGGYALTGSSTVSTTGTGEVYVVKLNSSFGIQWSKNIGGNDFDAGTNIIQTNDGGYAIVGRTNYWEFQIFVIKLDSLGNIQWSKQINYGLFDHGHSLLQTSDGGIVIAGRIYDSNFQNYTAVLLKLNSSGTILWSRTVAGFLDGAYAVVQSIDGAFVLAGIAQGANMDLLFTKVDTVGNVAWSRRVGGLGSETSIPGARLIRTSDNGFAYAGSTDSYGSGSNDMYLVKLTSTGTLQFAKAIGTNGYEIGYGITQTTDNGYVICGNILPNGASTSDTYLARTDSAGNLLWTRILGGSGEENGQSIVQCNDGSILVAGSTTSYNNSSDVHLIKLEINGSTCGTYSSNGIAVSGGTATLLTNITTASITLNNVNGPVNSFNGGTITDICGCSIPLAVITAPSLNICSGSSSTLLTNPTLGNTYTWLRNGIVISGATSSSYAATLGGNYVCIQSNSCGTDTSNSITMSAKSLPSAAISTNGNTSFCSGDSLKLDGPVNPNRSYQWIRNGVNIPNATSVSYYATQGGNYRLQVTNTLTGCAKTGGIVSASVNSLPSASATPLGPTTFCAGGSVTLQANSGTGLTYKWRRNGSFIAGATNITYTATTAGNYKVDVTNTNGCVKKSANVIVSVPCREGETMIAEDIKIYPNPSSGTFQLELLKEYSSNTLIRIYDPIGREVFNEISQEKVNTIDISPLEDGIYQILISNDDIQITKKLSKINIH